MPAQPAPGECRHKYKQVRRNYLSGAGEGHLEVRLEAGLGVPGDGAGARLVAAQTHLRLTQRHRPETTEAAQGGRREHLTVGGEFAAGERPTVTHLAANQRGALRRKRSRELSCVQKNLDTNQA